MTVENDDEMFMDRAIAAAGGVRGTTSPNPWVGAALVTNDGAVFVGATAPPGGMHAEASVLAQAGAATVGSTVYTTLEPCSHVGRTPPCADALIEAGVTRVVMGIEDPDGNVGGAGLRRLRDAGIEVATGLRSAEITAQLAPYLKHRRTGRPYVYVKMAMTIDGRTAAPDGTSKWITGAGAREDVHRLRASCDAIVVGANTVRVDDPSLTVRLDDGGERPQPLRVVLGDVAPDARVQPCLSLHGDVGEVLDELGRRGCLSVLLEGGASTIAAFHAAGLVDRYVFYVAPAITGGDDGRPVFAGSGIATMADLWRGRLVGVQRVGDDVKIELEPTS